MEREKSSLQQPVWFEHGKPALAYLAGNLVQLGQGYNLVRSPGFMFWL